MHECGKSGAQGVIHPTGSPSLDATCSSVEALLFMSRVLLAFPETEMSGVCRVEHRHYYAGSQMDCQISKHASMVSILK